MSFVLVLNKPYYGSVNSIFDDVIFAELCTTVVGHDSKEQGTLVLDLKLPTHFLLGVVIDVFSHNHFYFCYFGGLTSTLMCSSVLLSRPGAAAANCGIAIQTASSLCLVSANLCFLCLVYTP